MPKPCYPSVKNDFGKSRFYPETEGILPVFSYVDTGMIPLISAEIGGETRTLDSERAVRIIGFGIQTVTVTGVSKSILIGSQLIVYFQDSIKLLKFPHFSKLVNKINSPLCLWMAVTIVGVGLCSLFPCLIPRT